MGMHFSVYVGAYLLVPHRVASEMQERSLCSAHCGTRENLSKMRFCSHCGAPVTHEQTPLTRKRPSFGHLLGGDKEDWFWTPESGMGESLSIWLPNQGGGGEYADRDAETRPERLKPLPAEFVAEQKAALLAKYPGVLDAVREILGVEASLQVGVVPYWA